jgi:hypothetical protein
VEVKIILPIDAYVLALLGSFHFTNFKKLELNLVVSYYRNNENTTFSGFESKKLYPFTAAIPGCPAGEIISFYEEKIRRTLDCHGVQAALAFYYFDDCCWNCASPFHKRSECTNEENPGLHRVARKLHEVNHQPSLAVQKKRHERAKLYAN